MSAVIVTPEQEWDDYEREKLIALELYEAGVCDCGFHESIARDHRLWFIPELETCPLCAELAQWERGVEDKDAKVAEKFKDTPTVSRPADGRKVHVRRMTEREVEEMKDRKRKRLTDPDAAAPEQAAPVRRARGRRRPA